MAACSHRPEAGCLFVPCERYKGPVKRVCEYAVEVEAETEEAK